MARELGRNKAVQMIDEGRMGVGLCALKAFEKEEPVCAYPVDIITTSKGVRVSLHPGVPENLVKGYDADVCIAQHVGEDDGGAILDPVLTGVGEVIDPTMRYSLFPDQINMFGHYINDVYRPGMTKEEYERAIMDPVHGPNVTVEADSLVPGRKRSWVLYRTAEGNRIQLYRRRDLKQGVQAFAAVVALRAIQPNEPLRMAYGWDDYWAHMR